MVEDPSQSHISRKILLQREESRMCGMWHKRYIKEAYINMKKNILTDSETEKVLDKLEEMYPDAGCELRFDDIFQLLIAVVLSAQTTDKSVNGETGRLFAEYPDAEALSHAANSDVEDIIKRIGMYRTKAKNIINLSKDLCEKHDGNVPGDYDSLIALPGVGRKTANVVLSVGFGEQGIYFTIFGFFSDVTSIFI